MTEDAAELAEYGRDWTKVYAPAPSAIAFPRTHRRGRAAARALQRARRAGGAVGRAHRARRRRGGGARASWCSRSRACARMDPVDVLGATVRVQAGAITEAVHQHCAPARAHLAGRLRVEGLEPGRRQHRHQRRRREGHPLRAHPPVGARARRSCWPSGAGAGAQRRAREEQHRHRSPPALHRQRGHAGHHHRGDAEADAAARASSTCSSSRCRISPACCALPRRRAGRRSSLCAYEFFTDRCLARVQRHRKLRSPFAAPASTTCCSRSRARDADGARGLDGVALRARARAPTARMAQTRAQAAELWALREGISESLSATGLPHKNDIALPIAALEAFCAELDALLRARATRAGRSASSATSATATCTST